MNFFKKLFRKSKDAIDDLTESEQFEKVKDMDKDPAVQATVDSYLSDLK